jgi:hypothetical protein
MRVGSAGDVVDLDPAVVCALEMRVGYVAIIFSRQPVWSRASGENPRLVPLYDCEIRMWGAKVELLEAQLPYETTEWEIEFNGGSRSCFLPTEFRAAGPARLRLGPLGAPRIVVSGTGVSLYLGEQVGSFEQSLST